MTRNQRRARRKHADYRAYVSWQSMKARCQNPNHSAYKYYGGLGIKVCDRWQSFENFLADMGERPERKTLDRINTWGNYEPENCRWASIGQQSKNRRRPKKTFVPTVKHNKWTSWRKPNKSYFHFSHGDWYKVYVYGDLLGIRKGKLAAAWTVLNHVQP